MAEKLKVYSQETAKKAERPKAQCFNPVVGDEGIFLCGPVPYCFPNPRAIQYSASIKHAESPQEARYTLYTHTTSYKHISSICAGSNTHTCVGVFGKRSERTSKKKKRNKEKNP